MKTAPTFRWIDETRQHEVSRAYTAHLLRCWRKANGKRHARERFFRVGRGQYRIESTYHDGLVGEVLTR